MAARLDVSKLAYPAIRARLEALLPLAVDISGVSELLSVSERTVYAFRARPGFPEAVELSPGIRRYLVSDLIAWLCAQPRAAVASEPPQLAARRYRNGQRVEPRRREGTRI
jgi:predicted DNA-binding transcriptional regulator AlpA